VQYALWIGRALHGDLGASIWTGTPVIEEIAGRVGITLELTLLGITTAIIIAIPAGCLMATLRLGTQPPTASLGRMLAESRNFLNFSPWPAIFSGAAILLAALGFNLLGDGLQDRLDPRLRSRQ
jgi:peptide/nickel transport system permease protein